MTVEVPTDASRTRRIIAIAAASVVGAALLAGAVWAATRPGDEPPKQSAIEPAEETSATTVPPAPSAEPTGSGEATSPAQPVPPAAGEEPSAARSAKVVFRLGERLYVAAPDGSGATPVAPAAQRYALSPDGRTLAVVYAQGEDGRAGVLSLYDAATGAVRYAGEGAVRGTPVWYPDSSAVVYTVAAGENAVALRRVNADGSGDRAVASPGALPEVSPDGTLVAYHASEQPMTGDPVLVKGPKGGPVRVPKSDGATAWAWGPGGELYFAKPGTAEPAWGVWVWRPDDGSAPLATLSLAPPAFAVADLTPSPDGARLLVSAFGDDDYSRLWIVDASSGAAGQLSTRRDAYPCCWTSDGAILYFEGNAYQGETSALARIAPDGSGRRLIVTGAER